MRSFVFMLTTALAISLGGNAFGHEVRPAYLELRQIAAETYRVFWKVPAIGDLRLSIYPVLPQNCRPIAEPTKVETVGFYSETGILRCEGGIEVTRLRSTVSQPQ